MKTMQHVILTLLVLTSVALAGSLPKHESDLKTKSFTVKKGGILQLDTKIGRVSISTWEKNEVHAQVEGIEKGEDDLLRMTQSGNTIQIECTVQRKKQSKIHFVISIPTEFNLDVKTGAGSITIGEKQSITGKIKVMTGAGMIDVGKVKGSIDLHSGGGEIAIDDVQGDANVTTGGGNIECESISADAEIRTGGGNVHIKAVGMNLKCDVGGGSITVDEVGSSAIVHTGGGNIKLGKVSSDVQMHAGGGNIQLHGGSGDVHARTGGGNIHLENIAGAIQATTSAGNISCELQPNEKGRSMLATKAGNIELFLPANVKATIDVQIRTRFSWKSDAQDIYSDFEPSEKEKGTSTERFKINGGGHAISLETTIGKISIQKTKK